MRAQKLSAREWNVPLSDSYRDGINESMISDRSDFSPAFWLSGTRGRHGSIHYFRRYMSYPLLIGLTLILVLLLQHSFFPSG
jgi:hypothetical protein